MPMPAERGSHRIDRAACEAVWFYFDVDGAIEAQMAPGGSWLSCTAGTDPKGVSSYYRLVAGPDCGSPGSATVYAVGDHDLTWRLVASPETHIGRGRITIT